MIQDIIVFTIISLTAGYIVISFIKNLRVKKRSGNACGGCTGCDLSKNSAACSREF
ncbi:MAG TPA: FeoB-associated Cys-rich membrane protein [Melioribacteraceae bacterium]|nr:FeoB-associated Cys-rich membrane protein [Melioribacteraceae bacterium]